MNDENEIVTTAINQPIEESNEPKQTNTNDNSISDELVDAISSDIQSKEEVEEQQEPEPKHQVKINGVEKEVTQEELIREYQKARASDEKFQQAAEISKEAERLKSEYQQRYEQLNDHLYNLDAQIEMWQNEEQPDWNDLLENNPHQYLIEQEKFKNRSYALQQAYAAKEFAQQQQETMQLEELNKRVEEESKKLVNEVIPEWKDKGIREREESEIVQYLTDLGYSYEDLQGLNQSRASNIGLVRKAMLFDKALKKVKSVKNESHTMAKPVPTVGGNASASKKAINDPDISFDEFVKLRHEQIKSRR